MSGFLYRYFTMHPVNKNQKHYWLESLWCFIWEKIYAKTDWWNKTIRGDITDLPGTHWLKLTGKFSARLTSLDKEAITYVIQSIKNDADKTWYSSQLHAIYMKKCRTDLDTSRFMNKKNKKVKEKVSCSTSPCLTSVNFYSSE